MKAVIVLIFLMFTAQSCRKYGCTNPDATNYRKHAKEDDGSCVYPELREDLIGEYAVEITRETFLGVNQGIVTYNDTISIQKGFNYNVLEIGSSYYQIYFKRGKLYLMTRGYKSPPKGEGTLINNELNIYVTTYWINGNKISHTVTTGFKIN